ncbi:MAG: hypothetical protein Q9168_002470 [Polycauliona sp. 1 TL-2023]
METPQGQNKGPAFLAVALAFTVASAVFVLLRVYVRGWIRQCFGWDDGMVIFSMVAAVSTGFNIPEVLAGYGRHIDVLSEHQIIESLKWNYLATPLLVLSLAASKISICVLLLRVLDKTSTRLRRTFPYGIIVISTVNAGLSAGYALGQCQPVSKLWDHSVPGQCQDPKLYVKIGYANGAVVFSPLPGPF